MINYGAAINAGKSLVPDLRQMMMQDEQMQMQRERHKLGVQQAKAAQQQQQAQVQKDAEFREEADKVLLSGNPSDIRRLMVRYPERAKGMKDVFDSMDKERRTADLTQIGSIYARAQNGDIDGAAKILEDRIQADGVVDQADAQDQAILAGLRSENPVERKAATATIGMMLAAVEPDKFGEVFGKLDTKETKTGKQREYDWRVSQFGKEAADAWVASQDLIIGEAGAPILTPEQALNLTKGGGSVPSNNQPKGGDKRFANDGGSIIKELFPNARITQTRRDPNSKLGKANPRSYHTKTNAAVDLTPIPGMSFGQFISKIRSSGYDIIESRDEVKNPSHHATGPHWHVVLGPKPVSVKSPEEARLLPKGTVFVTPDGRRMRR